nr:MAG TPA: hypothetical protein [Caudoviricetes sp.]
MTMKTKKTLVWYGIFMTASILNQTESFRKDAVVAGVVYCLWAVLLIITFIHFKETKWED